MQTVERLHVEREKALSLRKAHRRLRSFVAEQSAAAVRLVEAVEGDDAAAEANASALQRLHRVKLADHALYQLEQISDAVGEEQRRRSTAEDSASAEAALPLNGSAEPAADHHSPASPASSKKAKKSRDAEAVKKEGAEESATRRKRAKGERGGPER